MEQNKQSNPKNYVVFDLFPGKNPENVSVVEHILEDDVHVYENDDFGMFTNFTCEIIDRLRNHIEKHGKIDELWFCGHARTNKLNSETDQGLYDEIDIKNLLIELQTLQMETGIIITDRIVFDGCNIFSDLEPEDVEFYRSSAHFMESEIVGTTSLLTSGTGVFNLGLHIDHLGKFIQFSPDGSVQKDRLDAKWIGLRTLGVITENNNEWTKDLKPFCPQ